MFRILQMPKNSLACKNGENTSTGRCSGDQFKVALSDDQTAVSLTCTKCGAETLLVVK